MAVLKVLLVEDHQEWQSILRERIKRALQDIGRASNSKIRVVAKFEEAWEALKKEGPWDLLVTDIGLGSSEARQKLGKQLARRASNLQVPTIVVSGTEGLTKQEVRDLLIEYGAKDFFSKPEFDGDKFITQVQRVLQALEPPQDPVPIYDAFISYSRKDSPWVRDTLLPRLERDGLRIYIDDRNFGIGAPLPVNVENAVEQSRKTLLILTPNWVASEWTAFEALLTHMKDPAGRGRRILPLMVKHCTPPSYLQMRHYVDLTNPSEFDFQIQRLVAAIRSEPLQPTSVEPMPVQKPVPPLRPLVREFSHERGLTVLRDLLTEADFETQMGFSILESRLLNNLQDERCYGVNETLRSERTRIMEELHRLSLTHLQRNFNDLCRS